MFPSIVISNGPRGPPRRSTPLFSSGFAHCSLSSWSLIDAVHQSDLIHSSYQIRIYDSPDYCELEWLFFYIYFFAAFASIWLQVPSIPFTWLSDSFTVKLFFSLMDEIRQVERWKKGSYILLYWENWRIKRSLSLCRYKYSDWLSCIWFCFLLSLAIIMFSKVFQLGESEL